MSGSKPLSLLQSQQTNAKTVTKLANMKQLSDAISDGVGSGCNISSDTLLWYTNRDTQTVRKRSRSPYV